MHNNKIKQDAHIRTYLRNIAVWLQGVSYWTQKLKVFLLLWSMLIQFFEHNLFYYTDMKGYLFAVCLLTICVILVESAPTKNDNPRPHFHNRLLVRDWVSAPTQNDEPQPPFHNRLLLRELVSAPRENNKPDFKEYPALKFPYLKWNLQIRTILLLMT